MCEYFFEWLEVDSVCVLGAEWVFVCVLVFVLVGLACACMLVGVRIE